MTIKPAFFFFAALATAALAAADIPTPTPAPRVLMVLSSEGRDGGKTRPGFEMDELAQAWAIVRDSGIDVVLASPSGGAVHADAYDPKDPANLRFLADEKARAMLDATHRIDAIDAKQFDAVFVIGGKGAMFDLAVDAELAQLLAQVHDAGGIVAAVCHGSAALAGVRLANGEWLVKDRRVTGFTGEEEAVFGKQWSAEFPFEIEGAMRERGARWSEAPLMMPNLAVDDRLITGQNPYSTGAVADALVRSLGRTPAPREARRDEASLALLQRAVAGEMQQARAELAAEPSRFQPELIGIVGHYQLQVASNPGQVTQALAAMELATPHFAAAELKVSRAEAHFRLGELAAARTLLDEVLAAQPALPAALALNERMTR